MPSHHIVLPDKLPSSAVPALVSDLQAARGADLSIDARGVRTLGARAAETLVRFKQVATADGHEVVVAASSDFEDDLRILGLHHLLLEGELDK